MNARTLPVLESNEPEADSFADSDDPAPVSLRAVARMMVAPKNVLARFTRAQLDQIILDAQDGPEICGCGE